MPKHAAVTLVAGVPTLVSQPGANVTSATWLVKGVGVVKILATVGEVVPADWSAAYEYSYGVGERNVLLADLFPGIVGANRIYALADAQTTLVISHA